MCNFLREYSDSLFLCTQTRPLYDWLNPLSFEKQAAFSNAPKAAVAHLVLRFCAPLLAMFLCTSPAAAAAPDF